MPVTALGAGVAANETNKISKSSGLMKFTFQQVTKNIRQDEGKKTCLRKQPNDKESATLREDRSRWRELQAQRL